MLDVLTLADCEQVRKWRNAEPAGLRTPHLLTVEQQAAFYRDVVCNPHSDHRYFAIRPDGSLDQLIGMGGLTFISAENGLAEISLVIDPDMRQLHKGERAAEDLLRFAFQRMRLQTVFGEVYMCNPAVAFWTKVTEKHEGYMTTLPRRKYWNGQLWDSLYFSISAERAKL